MKTLQEAQVGDIVVCDEYGMKSLALIEKITKTQIITHRGGKFRKSDGWLIGQDMPRYMIRLPENQNEIDEISTSHAKRKTIMRLQNTKWENFSLDQLEAITHLINNSPPPEIQSV